MIHKRSPSHLIDLILPEPLGYVVAQLRRQDWPELQCYHAHCTRCDPVVFLQNVRPVHTLQLIFAVGNSPAEAPASAAHDDGHLVELRHQQHIHEAFADESTPIPEYHFGLAYNLVDFILQQIANILIAANQIWVRVIGKARDFNKLASLCQRVGP